MGRVADRTSVASHTGQVAADPGDIDAAWEAADSKRLQVIRLRRDHGLDQPTAAVLAGLVYGEGEA